MAVRRPEGKHRAGGAGQCACLQHIRGTDPERGLAVRTGSSKCNRHSVRRNHWRSRGIAGQIERGLFGRINHCTNRMHRSGRVVKEHRGRRTQNHRCGHHRRPTKSFLLVRARGRSGGNCRGGAVRGDPLQFQLDVVRRLIALFRIFLQAGSYNVFEGRRGLRLERGDRFRISFQN